VIARGIRNRNPGNLDFNPAAFVRDPWVGELGLEQHPNPRFTTFDTARHGIRALCKILLTYHRHRRAADGSQIDTVQEIVDRWAPPIENDTDAYAAQVRDALDVERDQVINPEDPTTLMRLAAAIIRHENGTQPYGEDTLRAGAVMALDRPVIGLEPSLPKPLELWTATKGKAKTVWVPDDEFDVLARQHGVDPTVKNAFTVPPRWYTKGWPQIYMRARSLGLFPEHEARHAEDMLQGRGSFHK